MTLIIDGYNLLNAAGIVGRGRGPGGLERSRRALLNFLVASIEPDELEHTTIVFDAGEGAPRGLPRAFDYQGLSVRFASDHADADAMIEALIKANTAPKNLTVVSSDHRLHRAARRRRARAVDSERWYSEIVTRRRQQSQQSRQSSAKPSAPPTAKEVQYWLNEFQATEDDPFRPSPENPFPPGYAEDLLDEDL